VPELMQTDDLTPMMVNWGLSETLAYLRHLEVTGEAEKLEGSDPELWRLTGSPAAGLGARADQTG